MKRKKVMAILAAGLLVCGAVIAYAASQAMSVQVKAGRVLDSPNCFGKLVRALPYGTRINTLGQQGQWYKVASPAGWIHSSALSSQKIAFQSGSTTKVQADSQEMALAGKGFNKKVEAKYRASGKGNYAMVDKVERGYNFSGGQLKQFLAQGGLRAGEGQ